MVQYFRKLIVRPVGERESGCFLGLVRDGHGVGFLGSLSATSTNDSINSSFICNVAIEVSTRSYQQQKQQW